MKLVWIIIAVLAIASEIRAKVPAGYELICDEDGKPIKTMKHQANHKNKQARQPSQKKEPPSEKSTTKPGGTQSNPQNSVTVTETPVVSQRDDLNKAFSGSSSMVEKIFLSFISCLAYAAYAVFL